MAINEATTDFVTEFPISLGPPEASNPIEHEEIDITIAKNTDLIIPTDISDIVTTWLRSL